MLEKGENLSKDVLMVSTEKERSCKPTTRILTRIFVFVDRIAVTFVVTST
jgi:hypothetical protein